MTQHRTESALLAAPGYACSSAATTSGPAWFCAAKYNGRRPSWARAGKARHQHVKQAGSHVCASVCIVLKFVDLYIYIQTHIRTTHKHMH